MTFIKYNKYNTDFSYTPWRDEKEKWGTRGNRYRKRVRRQMWHRPPPPKKKGKKKTGKRNKKMRKREERK